MPSTGPACGRRSAVTVANVSSGAPCSLVANALADSRRSSAIPPAPRCRRDGARDGGGVRLTLDAIPRGGLARPAKWTRAHQGVGEGDL